MNEATYQHHGLSYENHAQPYHPHVGHRAHHVVGVSSIDKKRPADDLASTVDPTAAPPQPKRKRVPAPGAAAEVLARMAAAERLKDYAVPHSDAPPAASAPKRKPAPGAAQEALARMAAASKRQPAPGAAQQVLARMAEEDGATTYTAPTAKAVKYSHGTVVWAKMQSYPWWPAQVQYPTPEQQRIKHSSSDQFVVFYGTADYTWLPSSDIKLFDAANADYAKFAAIKKKEVQKAIDEAWTHLGRARPDIHGVPRIV